MKIQNILVPLDGSELSLSALEHATHLAKAMGGRLSLLRVGTSLTADALGIPELSQAFMAELTMQQARTDIALTQYLEGLAGPLREQGLEVEVLVESGDPATRIVEIAESEKVDLVVMSSHGRSGLKRWIYGSVAERVLHHVRCSLMVVRHQANP